MSITGVGDLSSSFLARRNNADLKIEFSQLAQELSSGRKTNPFGVTGGNSGPFIAIEHSLRLLDAFEESRKSVDQKLTYAEASFDTIARELEGFGPSLLVNLDAGHDVIDAKVRGGENKLSSVMSALSVRIGSIYVFSGVASETPPLVSSDDILTQLKTATAGAVDATDFLQRVDDWFALPGGFDTFGYAGGTAQTSGVKVSETHEVTFPMTAEDVELRNIIRDLAVVALVEDGAFASDPDERTELIRTTAGNIIQQESALTSLRAQIGILQETNADVATQNLAHKSGLSQMKNEIVAADLFETASRFEQVQFQLESFYLATSKAARLSLTGYLR